MTDPSGISIPIRVQTLVGVIPALPAVSLRLVDIERLGHLRQRLARVMERRGRDAVMGWRVRGTGEDQRLLFSVVTPEWLSKILATLFDERAFLSPHGLRSLSRRHTTPYQIPNLPGATIGYEPAESRTSMYGGNSNWRGPIWFPVNYLIIRALLQYEQFVGAETTVEYPTGSGRQVGLRDIAGDLADRLVGIWLPDADGHRPVYGGVDRLQSDPAWRDNLLFFEYFHGDNGAGLGAMHQTGWTALVADLLLDPPRSSQWLIFRDAAADGDHR
ncbi:MAG TPA: hypothetical protein VIT65_18820 [Microlunatus sp.]